MNWRWILMLSGLGILMSVASVQGWMPSSVWLSVGLVLVAALLLGYGVRQKLFLHGLLIGIIWGLAGALLVYMNWDTFLANNPEAFQKMNEALEKMGDAGVNFDMRSMMLMNGLFGAAINGVVLGLLAMLAGKLLGEKPVPRAEDGSPPVEV